MELADIDILLFERIKEDDRLALNTLFTSYYQKLCRFANTYLNHPEESEEVVADVFVNIWKSRHGLKIERNLKSYLYSSVKHGCLAVLRKHRPELVSEYDVSSLTDVIDTSNPDQTYDYHELQQHVDQAVDKLPLRCRQIFIMSRFDGLKYKEIAEILGIAEKTVENQLVKALSIIRDSVKKYQSGGDHALTLT